jgi:proteasome component ECM29
LYAHTFTHTPSFISHHITALGSREWRARQSACLALSALISGRRYAQLGKHYERLWQLTFRVLDDVKESVQGAAATLGADLARITERVCAPKQTDAGDAADAIAVILPLLVGEHGGITHRVKSVRALCTATLMRVVRVGDTLLRPHLANLVRALLEALGDTESMALSVG